MCKCLFSTNFVYIVHHVYVCVCVCLCQIHVLKIFGGLPETCHMCRLLDVESVRLLCEMHKVDIPPILDQLLNSIPSLSDRKGWFGVCECVFVCVCVLVVVVGYVAVVGGTAKDHYFLCLLEELYSLHVIVVWFTC